MFQKTILKLESLAVINIAESFQKLLHGDYLFCLTWKKISFVYIKLTRKKVRELEDSKKIDSNQKKSS